MEPDLHGFRAPGLRKLLEISRLKGGELTDRSSLTIKGRRTNRSVSSTGCSFITMVIQLTTILSSTSPGLLPASA